MENEMTGSNQWYTITSLNFHRSAKLALVLAPSLFSRGNALKGFADCRVVVRGPRNGCAVGGWVMGSLVGR
jgi:hypothetical protein